MTITNIEKAFEKAGYELGAKGFLEKETMDKARSHIVKSTEIYIDYARIYWDYVRQAYDEGIHDENIIAQRVIRDPVILMNELNTYIDPAATTRIKATLYFILQTEI